MKKNNEYIYNGNLLDRNGKDYKGVKYYMNSLLDCKDFIYNKKGFNEKGFNNLGFNKKGFNEKGYNEDGFNEKGFDEQGFNIYGVNQQKRDRDGLLIINRVSPALTKQTIDLLLSRIKLLEERICLLKYE